MYFSCPRIGHFTNYLRLFSFPLFLNYTFYNYLHVIFFSVSAVHTSRLSKPSFFRNTENQQRNDTTRNNFFQQIHRTQSMCVRERQGEGNRLCGRESATCPLPLNSQRLLKVGRRNRSQVPLACNHPLALYRYISTTYDSNQFT